MRRDVKTSLTFSVLSPRECEEIHYGVQEVLQDVGVIVHHHEALKIFQRGGAHVENRRVRLSSSMVDKSLRSAPSSIILYNRSGEEELLLEGHHSYFGPGPTTTYTRDPYTNERRHPLLADTKRAARVMDSLSHIDFLMDFGTARDVKTEVADVYLFATLLTNSTKPILHWGYNRENYQRMIQMATEIAGSLEDLQKKPFFCLYGEPTTPLQHSQEAIDKMIFMAEKSLPSIYTPAPMMGATAPSTPAATLVINLAETISGLVLSQLIQEGAPFIIGGVPTIMDMSTTIMSYGAPEFSLMGAALADMGHFYGLPVFTTAGCTDAKLVDEQAAVEASISCLMAALSGANLIHDVGYTEYGSTSNLTQLVMADEIIGMVRRICQGFMVNEQTLALKEIKDVGPGGHFLNREHTFQTFKSHTFFPTLLSRETWEEWVRAGELTFGERARRKALDLIESHEVEPLPKTISSAIDRQLEDLS